MLHSGRRSAASSFRRGEAKSGGENVDWGAIARARASAVVGPARARRCENASGFRLKRLGAIQENLYVSSWKRQVSNEDVECERIHLRLRISSLVVRCSSILFVSNLNWMRELLCGEEFKWKATNLLLKLSNFCEDGGSFWVLRADGENLSVN